MGSNHTVVPGDSIASLAKQYGFFAPDVWDHANNADLKALRENPNTLLEGDTVYIPDLTPKDLSLATEQRHTFRRLGIPSKITLQLLNQGNPRVGVPFTVTLDDGTVISGETDGDGYIKASVQPERESCVVEFTNRFGKPRKKAIRLGSLDPVTEVRGVQQRLKNLGCKLDVSGELDEVTERELRTFQAKHSLEVTGEIGKETTDKLKEVCGS